MKTMISRSVFLVTAGLLIALLLHFEQLPAPIQQSSNLSLPSPEFVTKSASSTHDAADRKLVRSLLTENLAVRTFDFSTIAEASSGKQVLALDRKNPAHQRVIAAIETAIFAAIAEFNANDSVVQKTPRINEVSRFFEDALLKKINVMQGMHCEVPQTLAGKRQRSGYPDLRITDLASGDIFYLDPKLVATDSAGSSFRTFYFEPNIGTSKITDEAVHLIAGIEHGGKPGAWKFTGWRLVDVSKLRVRLKAEFQASNAELYRETELSISPANR